MYSNFFVLKEAFCQEKCAKEKYDYLKCIKSVKEYYMYKNEYNSKRFKCHVYLKSYLSCINYKTAPSIIEE